VKGTLLDEASGVKKKDTELVVVSKTPKQPSSGGWNKVHCFTVLLYLCFFMYSAKADTVAFSAFRLLIG